VAISREQALVYELLANVAVRFVAGMSAVVGFWIVLYYFVQNPSIAHAAMEGAIGWIIKLVFSYYFPKGADDQPGGNNSIGEGGKLGHSTPELHPAPDVG